ncbi:helix-turn-helix domain-containing protein [Actinomadura harenae]|uniref:XRE family transcriptional regulator n=1 Tax=Actinomadura harenae TaxID=2483351 RepID=A0A3M2MFZ3_9ACTN|nr:helix-turn-helix transcriptional regulator [Actinomadura harenae]RMI46168.1 XRE family transcriptional regulator [Actinomadura harenae]
MGEDLDPLCDGTSVAGLAECLRRLRARAGNPSLRRLELWGQQNRRPLARSSTSDLLRGKRLPSRALLLAFLEACGVDPVEDTRWVAAWTLLAANRGAAVPVPAPLPERLAADIRTAGLLRLGNTYLPDLEWRQLFATVSELDIFVAYGQTWRHLHARELAQLARRPDARIRVILADPADTLTVRVLADRFAIGRQELVDRIENTRRDYQDLARPGGATIDIRYWPGDRTCSIHRFDDTAVLGLYSHGRTRTSAVPGLVCAEPGELFQFVKDELETITNGSRPAR